MKRKIIFIALIFGLLINSNQAQDKKLAQTGMKFLSVSTDARMTGLSEASTAVDIANASAMFYNPSTLASMKEFSSVSFGNVSWIADINYLHAAAAFAPFDGLYGVFGFTFTTVDYGEFMGTIVAKNEQGYIDVGNYSPKAYAFGISYARALSDKFSVGGSVKYAKQDLGGSVIDIDSTGTYVKEDNKLGAMAFDFGVLYRTGFKSLTFGMSIKNFSTELKYKKETFQLPLMFRIGFSIDAMDLFEIDKNTHSLLLSIDAAHPRDYSEQIYAGAEYTFLNSFSIRAGFVSPSDEQNFTAGFGIKRNLSGVNVGIDYAYQPFGIFNDVHRFTFNFSF
ncbi:MAG: PorV/PorQ family protein [Melioribacteraceae bacterium]|nr:PorV/PorQ family protein [Melioribacteraceae bacterium]